MTAALSGEAVIVCAQIAAGHDGSAELVVSLRLANGVEGPVILSGEAGLELMRRCGAATLDELAGQSWRKILGEA